MSAHSLVPCTFHTHIWLKFEPCPHFSHGHPHANPCVRPLHFDLHSLLLSLPPVLLPLPLLPPQRRATAEARQEDHGKPVRLRHQRGEGTYDVLYLPTSCESNGHDFNKLQNSSVPFSYKIPTADQDVDDLTLGEMLSEACRGQVHYFVQEGVSVSQLSSSVRFNRSGQLDERNSSKAQKFWNFVKLINEVLHRWKN